MHIVSPLLVVLYLQGTIDANLSVLYTAVDINVGPEEQIVNCNQPDAEDENEDEEAVAMNEEPNSGN